MDNCLFCKIIKGDIPCYKIYEDEYTLAFLDIAKDADGHTLVLPKKHCSSLLDCDQETLNHVMSTVKLISNHYVNNCGYTGVNVLNNNGSSAEQSISHLHIHIFPRVEDDNLNVFPKLNDAKYTLEENLEKLKIK
jgi:histidine triad (HIT) family protein